MSELRLEPKILDFEISFFLSKSLVLIENWIFLLVDVKLKDTTKPKSERRKDLFLAANKENTRDLSQSSISLKCTMRKVLS